MNWPLIAIAAINLTLSAAGDICAKLWGVTNSDKWFVIGLGINVLTIASFMGVIRYGSLSVAATFVLLLTIILNILIGVAIFGESVKTSQWFGIALGFVAVLFIAGVVKLPFDPVKNDPLEQHGEK